MKSVAQSGFTLIEILVVVTIIGLLAAVGTVSYTQFLKSSRDATRKADLENVRAALELYRSENNVYPSDYTVLDDSPKYMNSLPVDPISTQNYRYQGVPSGCTIACTDYNLGAYLEVTSSCSVTFSPACKTGLGCNYCLNALGKN